MRRGEAARDPDDVELAVRAAAQLDYVRRTMRSFELLTLPFFAAVLAVAINQHIYFVLYILAAGLLFWAATGTEAWWQRRRRNQSVEATRQLQGG